MDGGLRWQERQKAVMTNMGLIYFITTKPFQFQDRHEWKVWKYKETVILL